MLCFRTYCVFIDFWKEKEKSTLGLTKKIEKKCSKNLLIKSKLNHFFTHRTNVCSVSFSFSQVCSDRAFVCCLMLKCFWYGIYKYLLNWTLCYILSNFIIFIPFEWLTGCLLALREYEVVIDWCKCFDEWNFAKAYVIFYYAKFLFGNKDLI